ncbi:MAG: hypothetical protein Q9212_002997 [Teloschistes hypoglaucus]
MGSLRFSEYADSPTIFFPPQHNSFFPSSYSHFVQHHQPVKPVMPSGSANPSQGVPVKIDPPEASRPSRKRSRDESSDESSVSMESRVSGLVPIPRPTGSSSLAVPLDGPTSSFQDETDEWVQWQSGHSMPSLPDFQESASTAGEEQCQKERRKFRRQGADPDCSTMHGDEAKQEGLTADRDPAQDSMSLELGAGWKSMSDDPDKRAAARGWARFIETRFPVENVTILAQHSSDCMLANASGGIYVFTPNLKEAASIAKTWEGCVHELKANPNFPFSGREMLQQAESPDFNESSATRNADGEPMDSSSAESAKDLPITPSDADRPTNPFFENQRHDPSEDMVVD